MLTKLNFPKIKSSVIKMLIAACLTLLTGYILYLLMDLEVIRTSKDFFEYCINAIRPDVSILEKMLPAIDFTMYFNVFEQVFRYAAWSIPAVAALTTVYNFFYMFWTAAHRKKQHVGKCGKSILSLVNALYAACTYVSLFLIFAAGYMFLFFLVADMCERIKVFTVLIVIFSCIAAAAAIIGICLKISRLRSLDKGLCPENIGTYLAGVSFALTPAIIAGVIMLVYILFVLFLILAALLLCGNRSI